MESAQAAMGEGRGLDLFHVWEQQGEEIHSKKATFVLARCPVAGQKGAGIY